MKVIMFTGSRNRFPVASIVKILDQEQPDLVIAGDAPGTDAAVSWSCEQAWFCNAKFTADWKKHGKSAGPLRNQDMVDAMVLLGGRKVFAFPQTNNSGTTNCINKARQAGLEVEVSWPRKSSA